MMLKVTVELDWQGRGLMKRNIGTLIIGNDGTGDVEIGNYRYLIYDEELELKQKGHVRGFHRKSPVWALIQRCIMDRGDEGEDLDKLHEIVSEELRGEPQEDNSGLISAVMDALEGRR